METLISGVEKVGIQISILGNYVLVVVSNQLIVNWLLSTN